MEDMRNIDFPRHISKGRKKLLGRTRSKYEENIKSFLEN
jgi:hypothetical protein